MGAGRRWLGSAFVSLLGAFGGYAVYVDLEVRHHFADPSWPPHARFHFLWGEGLLVVVSALTVWGALGPLRRGESWARWALFGVVLVGWALPYGYVAWFLPAALPPAPLMHAVWALIFLALTGLVIASA